MEREEKQLNAWGRQVAAFESGRFAWMAVLITFQSCLGSVACMYIMQHDDTTWMLMICAVTTLMANGLFIAQSPARWCLAGFYTCVIVNALLLVANLLF